MNDGIVNIDLATVTLEEKRDALQQSLLALKKSAQTPGLSFYRIGQIQKAIQITNAILNGLPKKSKKTAPLPTTNEQ